MVAVTRRRLVAVSAAAGAGALLAACGGDEEGGGPSRGLARTVTEIEPQGTAATRDVELVNDALAREHVAVSAYAAAIPALPPALAARAERFLEQEEEHVRNLEDIVRQLGAIPVRAGDEAEVARPRSARAATELLVALERDLLREHLAVLPQLSSPDLRGSLASIAAAESGHAAALGGEVVR